LTLGRAQCLNRFVNSSIRQSDKFIGCQPGVHALRRIRRSKDRHNVVIRRLVFPSLVLALIALADRPVAAQDPPPDVETEIATAPVVFDGVPLFRVRGVSSLPAQTRADLIRDRLAAAAADPAVTIDSLRVVDEGDTTRVVAGDHALVTILDADASLEQVRRTELAAAHLSRLRGAIAGYRAARSPASLRRAAVNAIAATLVLALAVTALWQVRRRVEHLLTRRFQARIHTVGIQSFELMRAERIWGALRSTLVTLQTVAGLAMVLGYLGYVLAQFPWTRGSSRSMAALALGPLQVIGTGIVAHIPSLAFLAVLFYVVRLVVKLTRLFFEAVERGQVTLSGFAPEWAQPTYKIVRLALVAFGLIVAYPYIPGSQSAAFKGVSLFIGVVFSLGSSSMISNIIAGYMMTYRRAFKVGDRIKVGGSVGDVIEMRLQVTHLRSIKNEEIIVPNSQILTGEIVNYSSLAKTRGLILHTEVGIGYETPWRQVEAMLLMAAERTPGLSREPRAFVLERALGDFAIIYELNVYCANVSAMPELYAALHRHILDVFNEYGVQIMTPAYERDPLDAKIVREGDWYAAPAARPPTAAEHHSPVAG
jgi:small-conductance mechanosensitive channel